MRSSFVVVLTLLLLLVGCHREGPQKGRLQDSYARDPVLNLISAIPSPLSPNQKPRALISAVNRMLPLGKVKCIQLLRKFAEDYPPLRSLVPLLFDDREGMRSDQAALARNLPYFFIRVEGDIPFHTSTAWRGSVPGGFGRLSIVEWADSHGSLRRSLLQPSPDPLGAADVLLNKLAQEGEPVTREVRDHIRAQARGLVAHLLEGSRTIKGKSVDISTDEAWNALKRQVRLLRIHWNEDFQDYEASNGTK
jgi:hypothetical protein